jgi:hypothetical protein
MSSKDIYIERIVQVAATPGYHDMKLVKMLTLSHIGQRQDPAMCQNNNFCFCKRKCL